MKVHVFTIIRNKNLIFFYKHPDPKVTHQEKGKTLINNQNRQVHSRQIKQKLDTKEDELDVQSSAQSQAFRKIEFVRKQ